MAWWLALFFTAAPETNTCVGGHVDKFGGSWAKETPHLQCMHPDVPTFPSNPPVDPIKTNEMSGVVISSRASQPLSGFIQISHVKLTAMKDLHYYTALAGTNFTCKHVKEMDGPPPK
jgi:hypothetical protein